jgi:hypothetical protein
MPILLTLYRSIHRCTEGCLFLQTLLPKLSASDQTDHYHNLACLCAVGGELQAASKLFEGAVSTRPNPELLVEYAQFLYAQNDLKRAIEVCQHPTFAFLLRPPDTHTTNNTHAAFDSRLSVSSVLSAASTATSSSSSPAPALSERLSHELLAYDENDSSLLLPALRALVRAPVLAALNRCGLDALYVGVRVLGLVTLVFVALKSAAQQQTAQKQQKPKQTQQKPAVQPPSVSTLQALARSALSALQQWVQFLCQQSAVRSQRRAEAAAAAASEPALSVLLDPMKEALLLVVSRYLLGMAWLEMGQPQKAEEQWTALWGAASTPFASVHSASSSAAAPAIDNRQHMKMLPPQLSVAMVNTINSKTQEVANAAALHSSKQASNYIV